MQALNQWFHARPWVWVYFATAAVWLVIIFASSRGAGDMFAVALQFSTFFVIIGLGQMLVIATGPGNIDLSMPSVMTLAGFLAMGTMDGSNANLLAGIAVGLGVGLAAGLGNTVLIQLFRIPPMIATLASGFIVYSIAIAFSAGSNAKPAPALDTFTHIRIVGIPVIALVFIAIAGLVAAVVYRTPFGRGVLAIGQNRRAAYLAGIPIRRIKAALFIISALLASVSGMLLAASSGGASLNMGKGYLLMSIAVVVLGGTSIFGGRVAVPGIWGAALLFYSIINLLNILGASSSVRHITIGLVIIVVLAIGHAGDPEY